MRFNEVFLKAMYNMGVKKCVGIISGEAEAISVDKSFSAVISNQVMRNNAQMSIYRFTQQIHASIICSLVAKGTIPDEHPQVLRSTNKYLDGAYHPPVLQERVEDIYLMILVGYDANRFLCSNICGSVKFGLPAAMAAQICASKTRAIAFCGNGGVNSTSQKLETRVRYSLSAVVVLLDPSVGLIKSYQHPDRSEADSRLTEFNPVNFTLYAMVNCVLTTKVTGICDPPDAPEKAFQTH